MEQLENEKARPHAGGENRRLCPAPEKFSRVDPSVGRYAPEGGRVLVIDQSGIFDRGQSSRVTGKAVATVETTTIGDQEKAVIGPCNLRPVQWVPFAWPELGTREAELERLRSYLPELVFRLRRTPGAIY